MAIVATPKRTEMDSNFEPPREHSWYEWVVVTGTDGNIWETQLYKADAGAVPVLLPWVNLGNAGVPFDHAYDNMAASAANWSTTTFLQEIYASSNNWLGYLLELPGVPGGAAWQPSNDGTPSQTIYVEPLSGPAFGVINWYLCPSQGTPFTRNICSRHHLANAPGLILPEDVIFP